MRLLRFLEDLPPTAIILCSLLFLAVVGAVDYLTGPYISLFIFYFVPISAVAWVVGRRAGLVFVVVAVAVWLTIDLLEQPNLSRWICCWNAGIRLCFYTVVTFILADLRLSRVRLQRALSGYAFTLHRFCDGSEFLCGIVDVTGEEMVIVAVNQALADLHHSTPEALKGKRAEELGLPTEATDLWLSQCYAAKRIGEPQQFEFTLLTAEGPRLMQATVTHLGAPEFGRERLAFVENEVTRGKTPTD